MIDEMNYGAISRLLISHLSLPLPRSALEVQLEAKRRQLSSLSAEKHKKKLRRHEAKLKEQIAQMEEQCKRIQQERESSTSADESAAGSPFHTPKAAALSAGVATSLPPSISAMANKAGAAVSESVVVDEKDLVNRVSLGMIMR